MAFPKDVFPADDHCEICGVPLGDEVVIQEFADGSTARLCPECAAGAALEETSLEHSGDMLGHNVKAGDVSADSRSVDNGAAHDVTPSSEAADIWAADHGTAVHGAADRGTVDNEAVFPPWEGEEVLPPHIADADPLERTRELLSPVSDLISLQREMQTVLERLAASLERFAAEVLSESLDTKTTVENRLRTLERQLEETRARLRDTEALLVTGSIAAPVSPPPVVEPTGVVPPPGAAITTPKPEAALAAASSDKTTGATAAGPATTGAAAAATGATALGSTATAAPASAAAGTAGEPGGTAGAAPATVTSGPSSAAVPPSPAAPISEAESQPASFRLEEVQLVQKYFNESPFVAKTRDVRHSLGKPRVNLSRVAVGDNRVLVTVLWDIVWYQYMVDIGRNVPSDRRVILFREGLDPDELAEPFKERNAAIDDDGRLDASELEVKLLSDPSALITELSPEEEKALEDATEEIWNQHTPPEFKWDD